MVIDAVAKQTAQDRKIKEAIEEYFAQANKQLTCNTHIKHHHVWNK